MAADWAALTKQIKDASDIVSVVGGYLALHPKGPRYLAICPFHQDSRPSLDVDPARQRYKCWACGAFGDVFKFVMEQEKVDFKEARALLAKKANIALDGDAKPDYQRIRMQECLRWAQQQYQELLLNGDEAEEARDYLGRRKLNGNTVRAFGLGFAPAAGDWIVRRAPAAAIDPQTLLDVGLIGQSNHGSGFYDRFRDRVMFPIRDPRGQTVGFGGRILPSSPNANNSPKYYNSTETPLFSKSELLFGLDSARHVAAKTGTLAIVEGYTDVMMAHQFGIGNVVATMGTALNARHLTQLRRYVPKEVRVVLVFDADAGGQTGIDRALEVFVGNEVDLLVAVLPESLDPCDLLLTPGGKEIFEGVLAAAVDALDYKLDALLAKEPANVEGRRRVMEALLGVMAAAPEATEGSAKVRAELMLQKLGQRLGLLPETVRGRYRELRDQKRRVVKADARPAAGEMPAPDSARAPQLEIQLLELLLGHPDLIPAAKPAIRPDDVTHPGLKKLLACLYLLKDQGMPADEDGLRYYIDTPALIDRALQMQDVGRRIAAEDAAGWLGRIAEQFAGRKDEGARRIIQERLLTSGGDHGAALELLKSLQHRPAAAGSPEPAAAGTP